ncbi:cell division protein FtsQ/DivIB [Halothiobacillus sp.]|jgi:cell division protein FtsQ|uniref:cell division protein FtsQ/DivIB n=1 Tax=Halothiobacillus sp. TaxID=1891311 RepID=UPI0026180EFA|nr:cell division protein FtsQ/DivIB [Halothiobacillus sp.]MDD3575947.1 cell division protein FtsQ/DivIB [Halothiobacillus sp.]MDD4965453.1 cell division protein FtsQ/DivIB [Halothiobacillus sp.]MDY0147660.1 cell division protein FtsQ/DivIB [Halothiobacillus sp.]
MAAAARPVQARPKTPTLREQWDAFAQMAVRLLAVLFNWAITFALLGLLGLAGWGFWQKLQVPVTHIVVQGATPEASAHWVRQELSRVKGEDIWRVDLADVQAQLLKNTWLTHADVRRVWPDTLVVEIAIHHPIARWQGDQLLDSDGSVFQPNGMSRGLVNTEALPNLSGPDGRQWAVWERYLSLKPALAAQGLEMTGLIENSRGSLDVMLQGGTKIRLGTEQIESRLQRLLDVYPKTLAGKFDQIAVIDLRYTNGFSVQWRNPPAAAEKKK